MEIHAHGDKVEDKTENRGRDRCTENRGGAVTTEIGGSNKGKRKYVRISLLHQQLALPQTWDSSLRKAFFEMET